MHKNSPKADLILLFQWKYSLF